MLLGLQVLGGLWTMRRRVVLLWLGLAPLACVALYFLPSRFESHAVVQLKKNLTTSLSESAGLEFVSVGGRVDEDYREIQNRLLSSRDLFLEAARAFGQPQGEAPADRPGLEALADQLHRDLQLSRAPKSALIDLRMSGETPEGAQAKLTAFLSAYESLLYETYELGSILGAAVERLGESEARKSEAQASLAAFREELRVHDLVARVPELVEEVGRLDAEWATLDSEARAANARLASLEEAVERISPTFESPPSRLENKRRTSLLGLLADARRKVFDSPFLLGTPELETLLEPVQALEDELRVEPLFLEAPNPGEPNLGHQRLCADAALALAEASAATVRLERHEGLVRSRRARLEGLQARAQEYEQLLDRDREATRLVDARRALVDELKLASEMFESDVLWSVKAIQAPTLSRAPNRPRLLVLAAALLAVLGAVSCVIIAIYAALDDRVRSPRHVLAAIGVAPLATLPDSSSPPSLRRFLAGATPSNAEQERLSAVPLLEWSGLPREALAVEADRILSAIGGDRDLSGGEGDRRRGRRLGLLGAEGGSGVTTVASLLARRIEVLGLALEVCDLGAIRRADPTDRGQEGPLGPAESFAERLRTVDCLLLVVDAGQAERDRLKFALACTSLPGGPSVGVVLNRRRSEQPKLLEDLQDAA